MTYTINGQHANEAEVENLFMEEDGFCPEEYAEIMGGNWRKLRVGSDENNAWIERAY